MWNPVDHAGRQRAGRNHHAPWARSRIKYASTIMEEQLLRRRQRWHQRSGAAAPKRAWDRGIVVYRPAADEVSSWPVARRPGGVAGATRQPSFLGRSTQNPIGSPFKGRMGAAILRARSGERAMILIELMLALTVGLFLLLVLPLVLLMAGIAGVVLLWFLAPAAVLAVLAFWWIFPAFHGTAAVLLLIVIALFLLERRAKYRVYHEP
jgi:hypothetical protein